MKGALVVILGSLVLASGAQAVTLVNPDGTSVGGVWQKWADEAKVATGDYTVIFDPTSRCGPTALGCSWGPYLIANGRLRMLASGDSPFSTSVSMAAGNYGARDVLYFELGHQFDWHMLTWRTRRYLAREWGRRHAHWWNSTTALQASGEDGLEADFASLFESCALGYGSDKGGSLKITAQQPTPPSIRPRINACWLINRLASRG